MSKQHIGVGIVATHDIQRLTRCIDSCTRAQSRKPDSVWVVVDSISPSVGSFYAQVKSVCESFGARCMRSESSGTPGSGKNALYRWLSGHDGDGVFVLVDGDDMLYPCAIAHVERIHLATGFDVLSVQSQDQVTVDPVESITNFECAFGGNPIGLWLQTWGDAQPDLHGQKSYIPCHDSDMWSPDRVVAMSSRALRCHGCKCHPDLRIYEDWYLSACLLAESLIEGLRYITTSFSDIYVYDRTNTSSLTSRAPWKDWVDAKVELVDSFRDTHWYQRLIDARVDRPEFFRVDESNRLHINERCEFVARMFTSYATQREAHDVRTY